MRPPARATVTVMPRARVAATTGMAPAPHMRLLHNMVAVPRVQEEGQQRRPEEEQRLHDPQRKRGLQHRAGLVHLQRERVIRATTVLAERAERNPYRAAIPVRAVSIGDEAELVDGRDEGTEEEEVDEGDEHGGAFRGGESDQSVDGPEDGDHADDEHDEDVGGREHVGFQVSVDEVRLVGMLAWVALRMAGVYSKERTSMPTMGIRKVISTMRLKMKKTLPIMMARGARDSGRGRRSRSLECDEARIQKSAESRDERYVDRRATPAATE